MGGFEDLSGLKLRAITKMAVGDMHAFVNCKLSSIIRDTAFTSYAVMLCVLVRRNKGGGGGGSLDTTYSTYNG